MSSLPRLDILIYCHDGRGLGHASRSVAIGMAIRRLYPHLKVLFLSGCQAAADLINDAPLDWFKLPSYETKVIDGKSRGIDGKSNYSDKELGVLRAATIKHCVQLYRPRIILVDHQPQGKHRELLPALEATISTDSKWVLGVRGVIGGVSQVRSQIPAQVFSTYYHDLFWYGDSHILGQTHLEFLAQQFGRAGKETGYVSRQRELEYYRNPCGNTTSAIAGTIAIPWFGEATPQVLISLAEALHNIGNNFGRWYIYIGTTPEQQHSVNTALTTLGTLPYCTIKQTGPDYLETLARSRTALIYGGYNSIVDILHTRIPAIVLLRDMKDKEQDIHLNQITRHSKSMLTPLAETKVTADQLQELLLENLTTTHSQEHGINLAGAEKSATLLNQLL